MDPSPVKGAGNWVPVAKTPPPSRRARSFSSSSSTSPSSMSSSSADSHGRWSRTLSGIPFSWEQQPGIPKESHSPASKGRLACQDLLLPLPPAAPSMISKKKPLSSWEEDPFMAALKECSKDHHHHHHHFPQSHLQVEEAKVSRSLSDRFGSCKRTCSVIESTVFVRKPNRRGYYLLDRRSA